MTSTEYLAPTGGSGLPQPPVKRYRGFDAPDPAGAPRPGPHISPRPALVSYRVALVLYPGDTLEPRTPTRREEDTDIDTPDRTAWMRLGC
jgi:hypothetical protein